MRALLVLLLGCDLVPDIYTADGERDCDPRQAFYADGDADGLGDPLLVYVGCEALPGYVAVAGDCDDAEATIGACDSADTAE
ncbi:MAG: hypothetical protein EXR71_09980 [Myxococcales bacterium]|nr:hypothetical protein [Myxococcales bacterium]